MVRLSEIDIRGLDRFSVRGLIRVVGDGAHPKVELVDKSVVLNCIKFGITESERSIIKEGNVADVSIEVKKSDKYGITYSIVRAVVAEHGGIEDFKLKAYNFDANLTYMKEVMERLKSGSVIEGITYKIIKRRWEKFIRSSASKSVHHSDEGGLLVHTCEVHKLAMQALELYGDVDREVVSCGALLHDIGKVEELELSKSGKSSYSYQSYLKNHSMIGIDMVSEEVADFESCKDSKVKIEKLKHCIASHHSNLEWGALVEPALQEAWIIHSADNLSAKMEISRKLLEECNTLELTHSNRYVGNENFKAIKM